MGAAAAPLIEGHLRFVVIDGSTVQGPGATGTWYRLHVTVDLVRLQLIYVKVTDAHEGERMEHYPLQEGDVVVMDRGYNQRSVATPRSRRASARSPPPPLPGGQKSRDRPR